MIFRPFVICLILVASASAQDVITSAAQVQALPTEVAELARPVRIEGVITYIDTASGQAWTLVVDRSRGAPGAKETVLVHFLMDDAPHEVLTAGTAFQLVEGSRIVAEGEVSDVFELSVAA